MNEFHAVSVDELTQVDGGSFLDKLAKVVELVVRVVKAVAPPPPTGRPIT